MHAYICHVFLMQVYTSSDADLLSPRTDSGRSGDLEEFLVPSNIPRICRVARELSNTEIRIPIANHTPASPPPPFHPLLSPRPSDFSYPPAVTRQLHPAVFAVDEVVFRANERAIDRHARS